MKKTLLYALAGMTVLVRTASASLFLNDWGVSYDHWNPSQFRGLSNFYTEDWKPGDNNNGWLGPGFGGQNFDVEAMYFGEDHDSYYFAVVTGFRPTGFGGYAPGDLFLDKGNDGHWDYAFDTSAGGALLSGIGSVERSDAGGGQTWGGVSDPFRVKMSTHTNRQGVAFRYGSFSGRYAIEARVDRSVIGSLDEGYRLHWTMGCGNDAGDLVGRAPEAPVPEPATMVLFGTGLAGLAARRFRRRA